MKKSRKSALWFVIMIIGFAIGLIIGRGIEFSDDDDDDDDFDLELFSD